MQATFVPSVIGLVPGLLFGGPFSDRFGRRRAMTPTLIASAVGTVSLILGGSGIDWIFAGRLVSGMASGAGFSCGDAWIKELSTAGGVRGEKGAGGRGGNVSPRRLTVAMGVGFGLGPLVAGILAQWAPAPTVTAYLPQLVLAAVALGWTAFAASRVPDRRPGEEPGAAARPGRPEPEQTSDGPRAATR